MDARFNGLARVSQSWLAPNQGHILAREAKQVLSVQNIDCCDEDQRKSDAKQKRCPHQLC